MLCVCMCVCVAGAGGVHVHTWGEGRLMSTHTIGHRFGEMLRSLGAPCHADVMRVGLASLEQCLPSWCLGCKHTANWTEPGKPSRVTV